MGVRASVCVIALASFTLGAPLGVGLEDGVALATPEAAAERPTLKPTTRRKVKKRRPTTRPRLGPKKKRKPKQRETPPPADPPPENPPPAPAVTCEAGECDVLVGITAAHNTARAAVGVAPLVWDTKLHQHATAWAQQLAQNGCHPLAHQQSNAYGENLYWNSHGGTAAGAVAAWTAEAANYDHETNSCTSGVICGHYTQVVWAASTRVGCGVASCGQERVWVCEYDPRGNYANQSPYSSSSDAPNTSPTTERDVRLQQNPAPTR